MFELICIERDEILLNAIFNYICSTMTLCSDAKKLNKIIIKDKKILLDNRYKKYYKDIEKIHLCIHDFEAGYMEGLKQVSNN